MFHKELLPGVTCHAKLQQFVIPKAARGHQFGNNTCATCKVSGEASISDAFALQPAGNLADTQGAVEWS